MHRLGVILPSSNTTVEYEFSRALQETDVSVHYVRVPLQEVTVQGHEEVSEPRFALYIREGEGLLR
jgi:maleate isomerase